MLTRHDLTLSICMFVFLFENWTSDSADFSHPFFFRHKNSNEMGFDFRVSPNSFWV